MTDPLHAASAALPEPPRTRQAGDAAGTHWEDLRPGAEIAGPGMTITEAHLVAWAGLTGDVVSLHLDEEYAAATTFGRRVAHGPLTMSLGLGLLTQTGIFTNVRAWLGVDSVRASVPVFIGDTIRPTAVLQTADAKDVRCGRWVLAYTVRNQRRETVMTFTSAMLVSRLPEGRSVDDAS